MQIVVLAVSGKCDRRREQNHADAVPTRLSGGGIMGESVRNFLMHINVKKITL